MTTNEDHPQTVTDAVELLHSLGYRDEFPIAEVVRNEKVVAVIDLTFRFEGDSDPGDEAIVLGVSLPADGRRGIIVSAYGADASRETIALFEHLSAS